MPSSNCQMSFIEKFDKYSGNRFDICYDIYVGLINANDEDRIELFTYACNNFGIRDTDNSYSPIGQGVSKSELRDLRKEYSNIIDSLLDSTIQKAITSSLSQKQFYTDVWNLIVQNPIFKSEKEHVYSLYYILLDPKIPFYQIDSGLEMSNSEFRRIIDECGAEIQKACFVLAVDFPQKTMEASNLLDIILSQQEYNNRVVILSRIISELREKNKDILDELMRKLEE